MATVVGTSPAGRRCSLGLAMLLMASPAVALEWEIVPVLSLGAVATDNASADARQDESLVLRVSPGVGVRRQGGRVRLGLDYRLEDLYYAQQGDNEIFHRLLGTATTELIRDRLFIDADASISQTLASAEGPLIEDNLVRNDDRTSVYSLSLNPYWINDYAGYAESLVSYELGHVHYDSARASDTLQQVASVQVGSGRRFTALNWNLAASLSHQEREGAAGDTEQRSLAGAIGYPLTDELSLVGEGGYQQVELSNRAFGRDGSFWRAGLSWLPSRFIRADALLGEDNSRFTLGLYPTVRTSLEVTRLNQEVGANTGVTWSGRASHRTRHSSWNLSHLDEVTTAQGLEFIELLLDDEGRFVDINGQPLDFERLQGNSGLLTPGGLFLLTDEEFRRRRTALDVTYTRRRNTFSLGLYRESRDFGDEADNRQVLGSNAGWSIRLAPRTR
ncbi:MAG: TIGR03016 family PEP-CTERM system-associated outer membrane protein, partial [Candidatus Competibacteraceae bacterium]|nr:TIGR03016 family PEP-CTERM system-associated outer membrane protein [Candidatus Competibacteraceae bacterium]